MLKFSRIAASLAERQASLEVSCTFRSHILTKSLHTSPKLLRMAAPSSSEAQPNPAGPGTAASVFLVTSPNAAVSRKIAESILTKKLAACVNLVPKITSLYVSPRLLARIVTAAGCAVGHVVLPLQLVAKVT